MAGLASGSVSLLCLDSKSDEGTIQTGATVQVNLLCLDSKSDEGTIHSALDTAG